METDTDTSTQTVTTDQKSEAVTTRRRSDRSASDSKSQRDTSSSRTGKTGPIPSGSKGPTAKPGTEKVRQALEKAGGLASPRSDLALITKRFDAKGKKKPFLLRLSALSNWAADI